MFNTARFNLQRFNLQAGNETDIKVLDLLEEKFGGAIGFGEDSYVAESLSEILYADVMAGPGAQIEAVGAEKYGAKARAYPEYYPMTDMNEEILGDNYLSSDAYELYDLIEAVSQETYLSADSYYEAIISATYSAQLWLGADHYNTYTLLCEIIDCDVTTSSFNTMTAMFNITIPPGGELVIDSDNYVVMLNGNNVIHTHSGDWVTLSPYTYDFVVSMGTGAPVDMTMIYEERFL